MDTGTCRALGAMYKQVRQAFKTGALGLWWEATNGIPQRRTLSVILVNVLTAIWKWEVDSLRRQVYARTAALPPVLDEDAADDLEPGALLPLKDAGPGYAALGSSAYADDTHAVALGAASLRQSPRRRSGCGSQGRTSAWTSLAPGSRGNKAPWRCWSGGPPSRW